MIEALLAYQKTDAKLKKIETELAKSEERTKMLTAKKYLETVEENLAKLEQRASELNAFYENAISTQKLLQEQISEFSHALSDLESQSEADYLQKKSDELLTKLKTLEDETGKLENEMKSVLKDFANLKNTTKKAKEQFTENKDKFSALKESRAEEIKKITDELNELKKKVDPALMEKYEKKRAEKIFPIVFEVRGEFCGACNMQMPSATLAKLKAGEIIECDQCRRILYLSK